MVLLWQQKHWNVLQSIKRKPCRVRQGHGSTFNHRWFEMWEHVSGSSRGHVFNNIMALLLVTKQALMSSRTPSAEVTFNENTSHNSLLVYLFLVVFVKIKFGIGRGHLVRAICCNLTMCWEASSDRLTLLDWVSQEAVQDGEPIEGRSLIKEKLLSLQRNGCWWQILHGQVIKCNRPA